MSDETRTEGIPVLTQFDEVKNFLPTYIQELYTRADEPEMQEILEFLVPFCLDSGIAQKREMSDDYAEEVAFLNRAAFITYLEEHYPDAESARPNICVHFLDIKDFRAADHVTDASGDKSADLIINKVAQKVSEKITHINSVLAESDGGMVIACRYGGDELALLFDRISDPSSRADILEFITNDVDGIKSIEGLFLRNGIPVKERVQLKEGIKEIFVPEDPIKAKVFWHQMHTGLLLSEEEIDNIIKYNGTDSTRVNFFENPTLPQIVERMDRLFQKHPEFEIVFDMVASLPVKSEKEQITLLSGLEKFIHENLYDRLLGDYVTNMSDFARHFLKRPFSRIHVIDVKGLKEINDNLSIAQGDLAIVEAWKKIQDVFEESDYRHAGIFRRGGTLLIGEYVTSGIGEEKRQKLLDIDHITLHYGNIDSHLSIAVGTKTLERSNAPGSTPEIKIMLNNIFREIDSLWYKNLIYTNIDHPEYFENRPIPENADIFLPEYFINVFLYGKRKEERCRIILECINELKREPRYVNLVDSLNTIGTIISASHSQ